VAGSMGPLGKPNAPGGRISDNEITDIFQEQAKALLEGEVDLVMLKTFSDIAELKLAVSAVRNSCQLPIIASMTFNEEGKTFDGHSAAEAGHDINRLEAEIIGVNCGAGPQNMADITKSLSQTSSKKLSIQPSAGLPRYVDGSFIYPTFPEYFPECTKDCIIAGANIIGGCCVTTPEFIRSLSRMLKNSNSAATDTHGLMKQE